MIFYDFTPQEIAAAVAVCNAGYNDGHLRFDTTRSWTVRNGTQQRTTGVLLLTNGRSPGARRSGSGRRTNSADWETHFVFMAALFAQRPDGRIVAGRTGTDYRNELDFYFKCNRVKAVNTGSRAAPRTFGSLSQRETPYGQ